MGRSLRLLLAVGAAFVCGAVSAQPDAGRDLFVRPDKGNCIACHQVPEGAGPVVRSDVGPRLDAGRLGGWNAARLREVIEDPARANPDTVMPPYGRHRILESGEIARIVEYLRALP
jgi:sulfur-oxidizing protein SoxX